MSLYGQFLCFSLHMTIIVGSLKKILKGLHEKMQKQHYVYCDYNNTSIIYINSNKALLSVKKPLNDNLQQGLANTARLAYHPSLHKILCLF